MHPLAVSISVILFVLQRSLQEKLEGAYLSMQEKAKESEQKLDAANAKNSQVCWHQETV